MNTVQGFAMASWETGYGDFVFKPDFATLRRVPWLERTALVVADLEWQDGARWSPRRGRSCAASSTGWPSGDGRANIGSELEFILFRDSYDQARAKRYHDLEPANPYNVDYSILGTTMVEDVLRPIRLGMAGAGITVEDAKGECNFGQHEVNFRYSDALTMADNHTVYKNGAKEIAWQHGYALTFMAKFNEREGNSCHIHCSLWDERGSLFPADDGHGLSRAARQFIAGQLAAGRELTATSSPPTSTRTSGTLRDRSPPPRWSGAPTTAPARFRVVGHGQGLRLENRIAGRRLQPVPGIRRDDRRRACTASTTSWSWSRSITGNAYEAADKPRLPGGLHEAADLLEGSELARDGVRRRGDRALPPLRAHRAGAPSTRPSPTGSASAGFERL